MTGARTEWIKAESLKNVQKCVDNARASIEQAASARDTNARASFEQAAASWHDLAKYWMEVHDGAATSE
jgi:hypothetical protein